MKKLLVPCLCLISVILVYIYKDKLVNFTTDFFTNKQDIVISGKNEYTRNKDYLYVQKTNKFEPLGYQDVLNIYYSIIDNHWENFTFYCPKEYKNCSKDITKLSEESVTISNINNFVHPYNSFTNIKTTIDSNGEVTIKVSYLYTKEQIDYINNEVDRIISENYNKDLPMRDNLKAIHDYIINTTKYDVNYEGNKAKLTYTAYGLLKEHLATCNGYTDLMAIILNKLNIDNYKIAYNPSGDTNSEGHVWNAVYIDNKWLHLDLTWDDPVSEGQDYLYHKYFLVTTEEMNDADSGEVQIIEHNYDKKI